MTGTERVLVVGGGPAGTTAAIALAGRGLTPEIVELDPEWTALGVGLLLQGPPLRALRSIGLIDACVDAGFPHEEVTMMTAAGDVLTVARSPQVAGPEYPPSVAMSRPALHRVLVERVRREGIPVRTGVSVERIEGHDEAVDVSFTDGSTGRYDLVVGADGLHSRVRALVFPEAPAPRYTGQTIWRTMVRRPEARRTYPIIFGPGGKLGLVPVSEDEMYVYLLRASPDEERPPAGERAALLREAMAGYNAEVDAIREEIVDPSAVDYRGLRALLLPAPWYRGRVVLIGDAAHTTTPHLAYGVGLAVEDSIVLAEEASKDDGVDAALRRFMERRYERCRLVVESSILLGEWEQHPGTPGADPGRVVAETFAAVAQPL